MDYERKFCERELVVEVKGLEKAKACKGALF
jgi:hypothetical protein